jgi:hypothetical protein
MTTTPHAEGTVSIGERRHGETVRMAIQLQLQVECLQQNNGASAIEPAGGALGRRKGRDAPDETVDRVATGQNRNRDGRRGRSNFSENNSSSMGIRLGGAGGRGRGRRKRRRRRSRKRVNRISIDGQRRRKRNRRMGRANEERASMLKSVAREAVSDEALSASVRPATMIDAVEVVADETRDATAAGSDFGDILQQHRVGEAEQLDGTIGGSMSLHELVPSGSRGIAHAKNDENRRLKVAGEGVEGANEGSEEDFLHLASAVGHTIDVIAAASAVRIELDDKTLGRATRKERGILAVDGGRGSRMRVRGGRSIAHDSEANARAQHRAAADKRLLRDADVAGIVGTESGEDEDDGRNGNMRQVAVGRMVIGGHSIAARIGGASRMAGQGQRVVIKARMIHADFSAPSAL